MHDSNTEILDSAFTAGITSDSDLHKQNPPPAETPQDCAVPASSLYLPSANDTDVSRTNDKHQSESTGKHKMLAQCTTVDTIPMANKSCMLYDAAAPYDLLSDFSLMDQAKNFSQHGIMSAPSIPGKDRSCLETLGSIYGTQVSPESCYADGSIQVGDLAPFCSVYDPNQWPDAALDEGQNVFQQARTDMSYGVYQTAPDASTHIPFCLDPQHAVSQLDNKMQVPVDNIDMNYLNDLKDQLMSQAAHTLPTNLFDIELEDLAKMTPAQTPQAALQSFRGLVDFKPKAFHTLPSPASSLSPNELSHDHVPQSTLNATMTLTGLEFDSFSGVDNLLFSNDSSGHAPFATEGNAIAPAYSATNVPQVHTTAYPTPPQTIPETLPYSGMTRSQQSLRNKEKDKFLLERKKEGWSYKDIKLHGGFEEAESTLRGRYRTLTKPKEQRVRKPEWTRRDVNVLMQIVTPYHNSISRNSSMQSRQSHRHGGRAQQRVVSRIPWKQVAECMAKEHGCYRFGNATVKKKYIEVLEKQGRAVDDLL